MTPTMQVVARQKRSMFVITIGVGTLTAVAGIACPFLQAPAWFTVLLCAWLVLWGAIVVVIGIASWHPDGIMLAFDDHGIHWHSPMLRKPQRFIPWSDVAAAHVVDCSEEDDDPSEAVILCLREHAPNPMGTLWSDRLSEELRQRFGESVPANVVFFQDDRSAWNPSEVAEEICKRIAS